MDALQRATEKMERCHAEECMTYEQLARGVWLDCIKECRRATKIKKDNTCNPKGDDLVAQTSFNYAISRQAYAFDKLLKKYS